jgi:hypothetical protein
MTAEEIEYAIEACFERKVDRIDDAFCSGRMDRAEYDAAMAEASAQVERDYAEARKTFPHAFA